MVFVVSIIQATMSPPCRHPPPPSPSPFQLNVSSSEVLSSDSDQSQENKVSLLPRPTTIFKVLPHHIPHLKPPTFIPKSRARVLTSSENRSILEQKAREKKEREELKEKRKKDEQFGILANSALGAYWVVSVNFENLLGYRTLDYEGQAPKKANGCGFG